MFIYTIVDVFSVIIISLIVIWEVTRRITEARCKHDGGVNETSACDAICRKCGKNLGFIGNWRDKP